MYARCHVLITNQILDTFPWTPGEEGQGGTGRGM